MKQTELQKAYSQIPQGFHNALLSAVSEVQEEQPVKKRHISLLVAVLIVALLCGTALAIINYYSVRDYQAGGKPSAEFEKLVVEIGETYENDYITLTIGDAIFDGNNLAVAMNLSSKDDTKPVYLYPRLEGDCGGQKLSVEVLGMRGDFMSGFLYPNLLRGDELDNNYGFDAELYNGTADGDVTWRFSVMVLAPNWRIENDPTVLRGDGNDPSMEEYHKLFRSAYESERILTTDGESLVSYIASVYPDSYGVLPMDDPAYRSMGELLADCGAFTLIDTLECTFVTKTPEVKRISEQTYAFDDYTVELDSLEFSYLSADYTLRCVYPNGKQPVENVYYELRDQNGTALVSMSSHSGPADDHSGIVYSGSVEPTRDDVTAITFVPYTFGADAQGVMRNLYDDAHAFTVELSVDQ